MLKLGGALAILTGCLSALKLWDMQGRTRLRQMESVICFLRWLSDSVKRQKRTMPDCFASYPAGEAALTDTLRTAAALLRENRFPDGASAWRSALEEHAGAWRLNSDQWEQLGGLGAAFFAGSSTRIREALAEEAKRMQGELSDAREEYRRQRRLFTPVGMLAGLMLVVILL